MAQRVMEAWREGTVYLRQTDKQKNVSYTEHRAWNTQLFIENVTTDALLNGGNCVAVTRDEYEAGIGRVVRRRVS